MFHWQISAPCAVHSNMISREAMRLMAIIDLFMWFMIGMMEIKAINMLYIYHINARENCIAKSTKNYIYNTNILSIL
jgi:hypothetical protein